jgi:hypothetical protein
LTEEALMDGGRELDKVFLMRNMSTLMLRREDDTVEVLFVLDRSKDNLLFLFTIHSTKRIIY